MSKPWARLATVPGRPVADDPERGAVGIAPALVPLAAVCVAMPASAGASAATVRAMRVNRGHRGGAR
jgi:hypothetical protein